MKLTHVHRKTTRTAEETARLRADRKRYQRDKPTPEELLAEGGHATAIPLGELLLLHQVAAALRKERERQGLTLTELSDRAHIDEAALSRLETGRHANPTIGTLLRIADALGKSIHCSLRSARRRGNSGRRSVRS